MNNSERKRRPWRVLLAVFATLAMFATACGSTAVDTSAADAANAAAEEAKAAAAAAEQRAADAEAALAEAGSGTSAEDVAAMQAEIDAANEATAAAQAEAEAANTAAMEAEEAAAMASEGDEATRSINVALVGNDNITRMGELAAEYFTPESGIEVNLTVLDEQTLREVTTRDVGAGGEQFDVVQIGMYETPQFGANGWLVPLNGFAATSTTYDIDDLIPAVRNGLSVNDQLFASPFYAESSFVMYRSDIIDNMPEAPTWDEVAAIAREVDSDEMAGICLRGKPGWGDLGAAFTTVLNTFGGTWWLANEDGSIGASQVDQPEFAEALNFYVDLLNDAGEDDAANSSFNECKTLYEEGKVAMWYDATVAASLFPDDVVENTAFALAPTKETDASGWLWAWTLAMPVSTSDREAAWEFIDWATNADYHEIIAAEDGWRAVPPGTRTSLYERPEYLEAAGAFAQRTLDAMLAAPIDNPGTTPRPGLPGVQYVGVPEFQDVGTQCTELFSAAIAGSMSVEDALADCHIIASEVSS